MNECLDELEKLKQLMGNDTGCGIPDTGESMKYLMLITFRSITF